VLEVDPDEVQRIGDELGQHDRRDRENGPKEGVAPAQPFCK
jgi:hypothetical protein